MTTKEFIRRSDYFNTLDLACISIFGRDYCWKITKVLGNNSVVTFTHDAFTYFSDLPAFFNYCDHVYVEKYSKTQFAIDLRYFRAFLCRLSKYQFESLKASGKCSHLLVFELLNNTTNV